MLLEMYLAGLLAVGTFRAGDRALAWWKQRRRSEAHSTNPFDFPDAESDDGRYTTL